MLGIKGEIRFDLTPQMIRELVIKAAREEGYELQNPNFEFKFGESSSSGYKTMTTLLNTTLILKKIKPHDGRGME